METEEEVISKEQLAEMDLQDRLAAIMEEVGPIKKTKRQGDTVSFKYRSIDDVCNALNPLYAKYRVTVQQKVIKYNIAMREFDKTFNGTTTKKIAYTADIHVAAIFSCRYKGEVQTEQWEEAAMSEDYADKALTQASSMAYKYAQLRKFCIPTEDITDPDSRQPDYRDTEHDQERSGPRPTAWLNENTPEWEEAETALRNGTATVEDIKAKWKVNKRQEEAMKGMYKKPFPNQQGQGPASDSQPKQEKSTTGTGNAPAGKTVMNKALWIATEHIQQAAGSDKAMLDAAFKNNPAAKAFANCVTKLQSGGIKLENIKGVYQLDDDVEKYFKSIEKQ